MAIVIHPRGGPRGMHLLVFADIHQDWGALRKIVAQKADLYICLGDLSNLGQGLDEGGRILSPLGERLWLLPGNNETADQIKDLCQKHRFFDFHQKIKKIGKFFFAGLGYSIKTPFDTPGEATEEEFKKILKKFSGFQNLCLFTHNPPKETQLDLLPTGAHVGSLSLRDFIEKEKPIYFFSAHIHGNEGKVERLGQTTCFCVGKNGFEIWLDF